MPTKTNTNTHYNHLKAKISYQRTVNFRISMNITIALIIIKLQIHFYTLPPFIPYSFACKKYEN